MNNYGIHHSLHYCHPCIQDKYYPVRDEFYQYHFHPKNVNLDVKFVGPQIGRNSNGSLNIDEILLENTTILLLLQLLKSNIIIYLYLPLVDRHSW